MVEVVLEWAEKKNVPEDALCPKFTVLVGSMDLGRDDVGGMQESLAKIELIEAVDLELSVEE